MSLRHPSHQSAIELGLMDTEYVEGLKREREQLQQELEILRRTPGREIGCDIINLRLTRIEELLKK